MSAPLLARPAALAARARQATHVLPMRTREMICCLTITAAGVLAMWAAVLLLGAAGGAR